MNDKLNPTDLNPQFTSGIENLDANLPETEESDAPIPSPYLDAGVEGENPEALLKNPTDSDSQWLVDQQRLAYVFGGADQWLKVRHDLHHWAKQSLSPELYQTLATNAEGVTMLYRLMMAEGEPRLSRSANNAHHQTSQALRRLMQQPSYWRDHDPQLVTEVTNGFRRLYDQ